MVIAVFDECINEQLCDNMISITTSEGGNVSTYCVFSSSVKDISICRFKYLKHVHVFISCLLPLESNQILSIDFFSYKSQHLYWTLETLLWAIRGHEHLCDVVRPLSVTVPAGTCRHPAVKTRVKACSEIAVPTPPSPYLLLLWLFWSVGRQLDLLMHLTVDGDARHVDDSFVYSRGGSAYKDKSAIDDFIMYRWCRFCCCGISIGDFLSPLPLFPRTSVLP